MFNVLTEINWLAVLVSTIVFAVLGGLYFSAIVAKPYAVALGNENKDLPKPGPIFIVGPLVSSLVVVITSAVLLKALSIGSLGDGIAFGLIVGIGYLVAQTFNIAINPNFPRPILYGLINAPYFIVCTVVASIILTVWQ
jgi:Protein of unknown function (DUF1761)